jgi:amino acid adenylation domain-containing protein
MNATSLIFLDETLEKEKAYWLNKLSGRLSVSSLPPDFVRPSIFVGHRETFSFGLKPEIRERFLQVCKKNEALSFTFIVTVLKICLHKYTGLEDIIVGTTIHKQYQETSPLNSVVALRDHVSSRATVRQLLESVKSTISDAYTYQKYPLDKILDLIKVERKDNQSPLFNAAVVMESIGDKCNLSHLQIDLIICVSDPEATNIISIEYNRELFKRETIEILANHFQTLFQAALNNPDCSIADLELLSADQKQQLLYEFNSAYCQYPYNNTVYDVFQEQARLYSSEIAVAFDDQNLTYEELDIRANKLAYYLRSIGVGLESRVGLCMERSLEMVVAILGILKADGAYVPIDPQYPKKRTALIIEDAGIHVIITHKGLASRVSEHNIRVVYIDTDWAQIALFSSEQPICDAVGHNLACINYVSDSTGTPKGVMVPHQAINRLVLHTNYITLDSSARIAQTSNCSQDTATLEIFSALLNGAQLIGFTDDIATSPDEFVERLKEQSITTLWLATTLFNQIASMTPDAFASVCDLVIVGEEVDPRSFKRVLEGAHPNRLLNGYDLPESTALSIWYSGQEVAEGATTIPIGRPTSNSQVYVLDDQMHAVGIGMAGELYISGHGLARGYLNRPGLTAERFVPNPFSKHEGERLYKTGDICRYLADGNIDFLGRKNNQVKIHGFCVELGEVESALLGYPGVKAATVTADKDVWGNRQLSAYITSFDGIPLSSEDLQSHLRGTLPEYMVPGICALSEALTSNSNGNVSRRDSPAPDHMRLEAGADFVAPETDTEMALAKIWSQALAGGPVGRNDNFYDLGGDSLLANLIISRVRDAFQIDIALRNFLNSPTVAQLGEIIENAIAETKNLKTPPIERVARNRDLPLSFSQERLWFLDKMEPGNPAYNIPSSLRLKGELDISALARSFSEVIRRHEILRTTFVINSGGRPVQIIKPARTIALEPLDLSQLPASQKEAYAHNLTIEEFNRPFDLEQGPVFRVKLLRIGEQEHILLMTMHHIVSDRWSTRILAQELVSFYKYYSTSSGELPADLPIQYVDYAAWQRKWLQAEVLESQLNYWKKQLDINSPRLALPVDHLRPTVQTYRGASHSLILARAEFDSIKELGRREGATLFMTLLAAFNTLLHRYTRQNDIYVGTAIANRPRKETEGLIGLFVNTLVLRTDLSGNPSFLEVLRRTREVAEEAYANQDIPFEKIIEELQPNRDLSHAPLFQVALTLQNHISSKVNLPGLALEALEIDNATAKYDMTLVATDNEGTLSLRVEYNVDLFKASTINQMLEHLRILLKNIIASPAQQISDVEIMTDAERYQILHGWNDTYVDYSDNTSVNELVALQSARTPDATALTYGLEHMTYKELNKRANQLAHYLQSLGVYTETVVAICEYRSLEMVIEILATLKAGAAYLPLNPSHPKGRLAHMLKEARPRVLLTQTGVSQAIPECDALIINLNTDWAIIDRQPEDAPLSGPTAESLAYIIYTSGSTGKPKGVMVQHRGICNLAEAQARAFGTCGNSRVLQFASFSFDASVSEIFVTLTAGASLHLENPQLLIPGPSLINILRERGITTVTLPPSVLASLRGRQLPALETVVTAGEVCTTEVVERWAEEHRLLNAYGPTEGTVCATIGECVDLNTKPTIGRPMANVRGYVLDDNLNATPIKTVGELYIAGEGLARGYLHNPDLTAARFIPDPFSDNPGNRLYRTGDLVRYLPDGSLEFINRIDDQVKLRGYRIELGEIEAVLSRHAMVQEAVVVAREDRAGDKRLVAYIVPNQDRVTPIADTYTESEAKNDQVELWPSVAEYYVYDDLLYYAMTNDERRNRSYKSAFDQHVKDKVVVDIGTGPDVILSRLCVEAGAKKVYAIELLEETYQRAQENIRKLNLQDKIILIRGDSREICLPEKADVCVSEIVGAIGGSEGAVPILNNARRFLKEGGRMIPQRSITLIAAVSFPDELINGPGFTETPRYYLEKIFEQVGYQFDLRLCVNNFPQANLLSNAEVFEYLDFTDCINPEYYREINFTIQKQGRLDGFLVWLNLHTMEGETIDILKHQHCWLPVYFPVFHPGIEVSIGDVIKAGCSSELSGNNLNPDYNIEGSILRKNAEKISFDYKSYYCRPNFKSTPFYEALFNGEYVKASRSGSGSSLDKGLRSYLSQYLPDYMLPSTYVTLDSFPLSANGKVDRKLLPEPEKFHADLQADYVMPRTDLERTITAVWQEVLQTEAVGINDNFFDLGGHSLLLVRINDGLRNKLGSDLQLREITLIDMFKYPTVSSLADYLEREEGRLSFPEQHNIQPIDARKGKSRLQQQRSRMRQAAGD